MKQNDSQRTGAPGGAHAPTPGDSAQVSRADSTLARPSSQFRGQKRVLDQEIRHLCLDDTPLIIIEALKVLKTTTNPGGDTSD